MYTGYMSTLEKYRIVGETEYVAHLPGVGMRATGTCDACGTCIRYAILVEPVGHDGPIRVVGTTCAEKVGLTAAEIRGYRASRYADERAERLERAEKFASEHGSHGEESRYMSGCRCTPCLEAAPHGTIHKATSPCVCDLCIDGLASHRNSGYETTTVLFDLEGNLVATQPKSGKYGMFWVVGDGMFVSAFPKREATMAKKGFREVEVPAIVRHYSNGGWSAQRLHLNGAWTVAP
jgi:hypothetical protein